MTRPNSSEPAKDEQTTRFRNILKGDMDEEVTIPPRLPPRVREQVPPASEPVVPARNGRAARLRASKLGAKPEGIPPEAESGKKLRREKIQSAFWTVTGTISLLVDAILIAIVIMLLFYVRSLNFKLNEMTKLSSMPLDTVRGLYSNFEKMNDAHIITTIPYDTEINVQFDIPLNQQTEVVLSQDTPINGARVTLTTGGLEISSAPANIVLPAGTRLPITLSLSVPVNRNVPVHLLVPVDIDLATSELGVPFTGLMDVLEPLYCMLDPMAIDARGMFICEKAKTP
jgi:hypothetical protein